MKTRFAALLLIVPMLLSFAASAAGTEYATYENPTVGYRIDYPTDWILLEKEGIDTVLAQVAGGNVSGFNAEALNPYKEQILAMDMMVAIGDKGVNFNVLYEETGVELTTDIILEQVCPMVIQGLQTMFESFEPVNTGAVYEAGGTTFCVIQYNYKTRGQDGAISQLFAGKGTRLYTITFTVPNKDTVDIDQIDTLSAEIAASFVP